MLSYFIEIRQTGLFLQSFVSDIDDISKLFDLPLSVGDLCKVVVSQV